MDKDAEGALARRVGRAIAKRRAEAGYTQEDVAEKLGLGRGAVARVEQGIAIPTVVRLVELAELFGCRVDDLLVEGSTRLVDQAGLIAKELAPLEPTERQLLVEWLIAFARQFSDR
jgi:transcriptional regulator with XRE-family HTH domain